MAIDTSTPIGLVNYYRSLLILQYRGQPKASAMIGAAVAPATLPQESVQQITLDLVPASGAFTLAYGEEVTASVAWNANATTLQADLRALTGLGSVTVLGALASQSLTITLTGVLPPALLLTVGSNTLLDSSSTQITLSILEIDQSLPLAVQNGFNLLGSSTAVGTQLDILGKYAGVTRSTIIMSGNVTLDDSDFLTLIRFAIVRNNSGSSLQTIDNLLYSFFPGEVLAVDYKNMQMSYVLSSSLGSETFFDVLLAEGILPKPMGVSLSVIIIPTVTNLFGFRTYDVANANAKPFNTYDDFHSDWIWLSYSDAIFV